MAKFESGPPGGRTLPQTATRLSDLAGGIYGPGASVASTGLNSHRPAIKAGIARAAGETWEDVLEYYLVNINPSTFRSSTLTLLIDVHSSTPNVAKSSSHSDWGKSSIKAVYILLLEVSLLEVKASAPSHVISSRRAGTSS
jgi:hypothetical protein